MAELRGPEETASKPPCHHQSMQTRHHPIVTPLLDIQHQYDGPSEAVTSPGEVPPDQQGTDPAAPLAWNGTVALGCTCGGWRWPRIDGPTALTGDLMARLWNNHVSAAADWERQRQGQQER